MDNHGGEGLPMEAEIHCAVIYLLAARPVWFRTKKALRYSVGRRRQQDHAGCDVSACYNNDHVTSPTPNKVHDMRRYLGIAGIVLTGRTVKLVRGR